MMIFDRNRHSRSCWTNFICGCLRNIKFYNFQFSFSIYASKSTRKSCNISNYISPTRIFFLGRENFPRRLTAEGSKHTLATWPTSLDTTGGKAKSVTIVANGSLLPEALKAADVLEAKGVGSIVIHGSAVNHVDLKTMKAALAKTDGRLVTVEDHRLVGGMGAILTQALVLADVPLKARSLGVGDKFGQSAYSALELYKRHGLDSEAIAKAAQALV